MRSVFSGLLSLLLCTGVFAGEDTFRDSFTRVEFPAKVEFNEEGQSFLLQATGVATRSKYVVKIYSAAHYLEDPIPGSLDDVLEQVFSDGKAKQLTTVWLHGLDAKRIVEGFYDSFASSLSPDQFAELKSSIDLFLSFYDDVIKPNDTHILRWTPGGSIELYFNGALKGKMADVNFAKALWGIWFGDKSVVDRGRLLKFVINS